MVKNAEPIDSELPLGLRVLDEYTILGKLAQGGMAEVYLAQMDTETTPELCVLKRVRPHLASDKDFVAMFTNEARLAAQINHKNVVQIYDLGQGGPAKSDWFLAMEYLDGRDMLQIGRACRAHNKAVPFYVTARIIADACAGLDFAHGLTSADDGQHLNLVHRDMSPENIVITFDGEVKVVDFGIAKAKDNSFRTQAGQIKGKLGYVAPEAIMGKPIDARADIFAIGATLYLFLCGRPAFTGQKPMEIFEKSLKPPTPPSEVNARVPAALEEICMRCLAREREDRYQSAAELKEALELYLTSTGRPLGPPQLAQFMQVVFPKDGDEDRKRISDLIEEGRSLAQPADVSGLTPYSDDDERTMITPDTPVDPTAAPASVDFDRWSSEGEHTVEVDQTLLSALGKSAGINTMSEPGDFVDLGDEESDEFSIDVPTMQIEQDATVIPPQPFSATMMPALSSENSAAPAATMPQTPQFKSESLDVAMDEEFNTLIRERVNDDPPSIEVDIAAMQEDALELKPYDDDEGHTQLDTSLMAPLPDPQLMHDTQLAIDAHLPELPAAPLPNLDDIAVGGTSQNIAVLNTVNKNVAPAKGASFIARGMSFMLGGVFALAILGLIFHFTGLIPVALRFFGVA